MNTGQIIKNAASNYGRMAVGIVTTLLLTPLILHKLGAEAYGLWTLTLAVAGYFGLVDLGITSAAIRYVAHYRALQDWPNLNKTIGSTLYCYIGMAAVSLLGSVVVACFAPHLFHVSPAHVLTLRLLIGNIGLMSAIGFATAMPTQCVIASQRLDALNKWQLIVQVIVAIVSAVGVLLGAGVLLLGGLQLFSSITNGLIGYLLSRKYIPQARFIPQWDPEQGRQVVSFAGAAAMISLAGRVIYYTDTLVIAAFISVAAVAVYAVGLKFVEFMRSFVGAGMGVLGTFASEQSALGNSNALARIWCEGTKWSLVITLPLTIVLTLCGREIITAWVGSKYVLAATVMAWLAVGQVFDQAQSSAYQVLMNTGRHKVLAALMLGEAAANLSLSIWLLHRFGIVGVAMGTSIPLIARCLFFYPFYMPRVTHMKLRDYLRQAVLPALFASLPAIGVAFVYKVLDLHHGRSSVFILISSVAVVTAPAVYGFCLNRHRRIQLKMAFSSRFLHRAADAVA